MANNYATLSQNKASSKFILARIEPGKYVSDDMVLNSGTTYRVQLDVETVSKVKVNGLFYSKITSGSPASGEFLYDETTKILYVNYGAALTTQRTVAYYYLFYSSLNSVFAHEEPYAGTGTIRLWENRIKNDPSLGVDLSDIQQGIIKTSNVNLTLENIDNHFQKYNTNVDSFSRKEVKIWHCINDVENIQNFYTGYGASLKIGNTFEISTDNAFTNFDTIAYPTQPRLGYEAPSRVTSFYNEDLFVDLNDEDIGLPIQEQISRVSRYKYLVPSANVFPASTPSINASTPEDAPRAINVSRSYFAALNRIWCIGYEFDVSGDHSETITGVTNPLAFTYDITVADSSYYLPDDEVFINSVSSANIFRVREILSSTQIRIQTGVTVSTVPVTNDTIIRKEISSVWISDPELDAQSTTPFIAMPFQPDDYSIYTADGYAFIEFTSSMESNIGIWTGPTTLSSSAKVFYRRWSNEDLNHGDIIKRLVERSGLSVNAASITAANLISKEISMTIPEANETEFGKIKDYIKKICQSTGGYLSLNSDNEVVYLLANTPGVSTERNENNILLNSFSKKIIYDDIRNEADFFNDNNYKVIDFSGNVTDTINGQFAEDLISKELHDVVKPIMVKHVLRDSSDIEQHFIDLNKERKQLTTYKTKTDPSAIIGNDVTYNFQGTTGNEIIIKTSKNSKEQTITTTDFLGV